MFGKCFFSPPIDVHGVYFHNGTYFCDVSGWWHYLQDGPWVSTGSVVTVAHLPPPPNGGRIRFLTTAIKLLLPVLVCAIGIALLS